MINGISNGTSAFYLPVYSSAEDSIYFYQIFKQALEAGYNADEALSIAVKRTSSSPTKKAKRIVEHNEKANNNTKRRK